MKSYLFCLLALLCLCVAPALHAQASSEVSDLYFQGFVANNEATRLEKNGDLDLAISKFKEAAAIFENIARNYPTYETEMRANRQRNITSAIARIEAAKSKSASASVAASEATRAAAALNAPQPAPAPQAAPAVESGPIGDMPSLNDMLRDWENKMRGRILQLEADKANLSLDLNKWSQWHDWAAGEMNRVNGENSALTKKATALQQAIIGMQAEVEAGKAASSQLDALKQQKAAVEAELARNAPKLAAAEKAAADASSKLATSTSSMAAVEAEKAKIDAERTKLLKERDDAVKARDEAVKKADVATQERDAASAKALGLATDLELLKKKSASGDVKKLIAENERLRADLAAAEKQVETLKADVSRKDQEITKLRGEITTLQGQLTTLRQESAQYQTQVADLTRQLKELKDMPANAPAGEANEIVTKENEMLRGIIMRQLRMQNRQQQAKDIIITELSKMENASTDLLKQVEELKNARMTLSPEEEKLFKDPAARELIGANGVQATLIAASADKPKPGSVNALLLRANEAFTTKDFSKAAEYYVDALRVEPKNVTALIGLGMTQQRAGRYADSEAALQKALAYEPDNDSAAYAMALTHFKQEKWKDSMTWFEKSLEKQPKNASARHYLGIISTKLSLMDRAEREFKTTLALDPNHGEAHFNLAVLYATWDPPQWDKARESYASALKKGVKPDQSLERLLEGGKKVSQN